MTEVLNRATLRQQLERFAEGRLPAATLAAWAFDQFCDETEELLSYEPGYEELIADVLDKLMWADTTPFVLDQDTARELQRQLDQKEPGRA